MKKYNLAFLIILLYNTKIFSKSEYDNIFIVRNSEPDKPLLNEEIKCQYPQKKCCNYDITGTKLNCYCADYCHDLYS